MRVDAAKMILDVTRPEQTEQGDLRVLQESPECDYVVSLTAKSVFDPVVRVARFSLFFCEQE